MELIAFSYAQVLEIFVTGFLSGLILSVLAFVCGSISQFGFSIMQA